MVGGRQRLLNKLNFDLCHSKNGNRENELTTKWGLLGVLGPPTQGLPCADWVHHGQRRALLLPTGKFQCG